MAAGRRRGSWTALERERALARRKAARCKRSGPASQPIGGSESEGELAAVGPAKRSGSQHRRLPAGCCTPWGRERGDARPLRPGQSRQPVPAGLRCGLPMQFFVAFIRQAAACRAPHETPAHSLAARIHSCMVLPVLRTPSVAESEPSFPAAMTDRLPSGSRETRHRSCMPSKNIAPPHPERHASRLPPVRCIVGSCKSISIVLPCLDARPVPAAIHIAGDSFMAGA